MEETRREEETLEPASNELNFEKALGRLEQIVRQLESGNVPLDELMKLYEEGEELIRFCNDKLSSAKAKVTVVREEDGKLTFSEFNE